MSFVKNLSEIRAKRIYGEKIYELITEKDNLPFGISIVFARESKLHHHEYTKEWYIVTSKNSEGFIYLNKERIPLKNYSLVYIEPGTRHKIEICDPRKQLEIVVVTHPPWSEKDHHIDEKSSYF